MSEVRNQKSEASKNKASRFCASLSAVCLAGLSAVSLADLPANLYGGSAHGGEVKGLKIAVATNCERLFTLLPRSRFLECSGY